MDINNNSITLWLDYYKAILSTQPSHLRSRIKIVAVDKRWYHILKDDIKGLKRKHNRFFVSIK